MRAGILAAMLAGCIPEGVYVCSESAACGEGTCEITGFCSEPDRECPSGRRYSDLAGDGLAERCVEEPAPGGSESGTGIDDSSGDDMATEDPEHMLPQCGDGIVDAGEACDETDDVIGDGCNPDCRVSGSVRWQVSIAGAAGGRDLAMGLGLLGSGDIVAVGAEEVAAGTTDMIALRLSDDDGSVAWTWRHGGDAEDDDELAAVAINAAGHIVTGGVEITVAEGARGWIGLLDGAGTLVRTVLPDTVAVHDVVGDAGGFVLVGSAVMTDTDGRVVAYREDEDVAQWTAGSGLTGADTYDAVARATRDDVFVAGNTIGDAFLHRVTAGVVQPLATFDGAAMQLDRVQGLARDEASGDLVLAGFHSTAFAHDAWLARVTTTGTTVWARVDRAVALAVDEELEDVVVDAQGDILAVGFRTGDDKDAYAVRLAPDGALKWEQILTEPGDAVARAIRIHADGHPVIAGERAGPDGSRDLWVAALEP